MMENAPSSCICDKSRGEMTWIPEKASACCGSQDRTSSSAASRPNSPPAQFKLLVKQQMPGAFPVLYGESGERLMLVVETQHPAKVNGADHVHVVHEEWRF